MCRIEQFRETEIEDTVGIVLFDFHWSALLTKQQNTRIFYYDLGSFIELICLYVTCAEFVVPFENHGWEASQGSDLWQRILTNIFSGIFTPKIKSRYLSAWPFLKSIFCVWEQADNISLLFFNNILYLWLKIFDFNKIIFSASISLYTLSDTAEAIMVICKETYHTSHHQWPTQIYDQIRGQMAKTINWKQIEIEEKHFFYRQRGLCMLHTTWSLHNIRLFATF